MVRLRSSPLFSVVIPTRNRATRLRTTLESLSAQTFRDFEVIVIDDGSGDETPSLLRHLSDAVQAPGHSLRISGQGRACARNAGLEIARGEGLVFIDDDRLCDPKMLAAYAAAFLQQDAIFLGWQRGVLSHVEPALWDCAIEGERVRQVLPLRPVSALSLLEPTQTASGNIPSHLCFEEPFFAEWFLPVHATFGDDFGGFQLPWALGATGNLAVRREHVEAVGGFDEAFTGWGLEDTELLYRLSLGGLGTAVVRGALNYHQLHVRPQKNWSDWCRNAQVLLAKHPADAIQRFVSGITSGLNLLETDSLLKADSQPSAPEFLALTNLTHRYLESVQVAAAAAVSS